MLFFAIRVSRTRSWWNWGTKRLRSSAQSGRLPLLGLVARHNRHWTSTAHPGRTVWRQTVRGFQTISVISWNSLKITGHRPHASPGASVNQRIFRNTKHAIQLFAVATSKVEQAANDNWQRPEKLSRQTNKFLQKSSVAAQAATQHSTQSQVKGQVSCSLLIELQQSDLLWKTLRFATCVRHTRAGVKYDCQKNLVGSGGGSSDYITNTVNHKRTHKGWLLSSPGRVKTIFQTTTY